MPCLHCLAARQFPEGRLLCKPPCAHRQLCDGTRCKQDALGPEQVGYQRGTFLEGWGGDGEMDGAAFDCRNADACIVFLGLSALGVSDYHPPLYQEHVRPAAASAACDGC